MSSIYGYEGELVQNWSVDGANDNPRGIATDGTYLYIWDQTDDEIYKYYENMTYTNVHWDTAASGNVDPGDLGANSTSVFSVDVVDGRIYVYDISDTGHVYDVDTIGSPNGITQNNNLFYLVGTDDVLYNYTADGSNLGTGFTLNNTGIYGLDTDGTYFYAVDNGDDHFYRYDYGGKQYHTFNISNESGASTSTAPVGVVKLGIYYYVVCSNTDNVYKFQAYDSDTTNPDLSVSYPKGIIKIHEYNTNLTLNWSANDTNLDSCWYNYNSTNITVTCADNTTNILITNYSNQDLTFYAEDSFGNVNSTSVSWEYTLFEYEQSFEESTFEGNTENFTINFTYDNVNFNNVRARLFYNGTVYDGITSNTGSNRVYSRSIEVPSISSEKNISFYWELGVNNDTWNVYNSSENNQTIKPLGLDDCSTYNMILYNLTLLDERLQTKINGTLYNTSIEVDIDFYSIGGTTPIIEYSNNFSKNNTILICLNESLSNATYEIDASFKYGGDGYAEEFYHIQRFTLINSSLPQEINLYDLNDDNAQEFKITYKDDTLLPVEDALIQIQRIYTAEGDAKNVEIPKTDSNGECRASFDLNNVKYTIIVVKNSVTLATFDEVTPSCQTPSLTECKINLKGTSTHISPDDFNSVDDLEFTLTFNETSRLVKSIFSVPSSASSTILLNVTLYDQLGNTSVCSDTLTSSSGTLSCTVPTSFGNSTVFATIHKNDVMVGSSYFSMEQKPRDLYGGSIVFLCLFLFLTLIGIGVGDNAMITGFFMILGLLLAGALNLVDSTGIIGMGATTLWLIVAIVLVLIKGAKRE